MDKTSIIGVILGIVAVGVGMYLKGVAFSALLNPAAFFDYYSRYSSRSTNCLPN